MVVFYNLITKEIIYTERDKILPQLPIGTTEEQSQILAQENIGFVGVPYEMDLEVFNYLVCHDEEGNFIGLQPKTQ